MDRTVDLWDISHYNQDEDSSAFKMEIYVKVNGEVPFAEFMSGLRPQLKAKVLRDLDILERFGNKLRAPYTKSLEDGIFELRTISGNDITRTLYFFYVRRTIVITHGFVKKQKKTPRREIEKAIEYRKDWLRRNRDEV